MLPAFSQQISTPLLAGVQIIFGKILDLFTKFDTLLWMIK